MSTGVKEEGWMHCSFFLPFLRSLKSHVISISFILVASIEQLQLAERKGQTVKDGEPFPVASKIVHQDRSTGNKRNILEALGMAMTEVTAVLLKELFGSHALVASDLLHVARKEGRLALADVFHQVQQHFQLGVVWRLNLWISTLGRLLGLSGVLGISGIFGLLGLLGVLGIRGIHLGVLVNELLGILIQTLEKTAEVPQAALAERTGNGSKESWSVLGLARQSQLRWKIWSLTEREQVVLALVAGDRFEDDRSRRLF